MSPKLTICMNLVRACVEKNERVVVMSNSLADIFYIQTQMVATRLGGIDWKLAENYEIIADSFNANIRDRAETLERMKDTNTTLRVAFMTKVIASTGITITAFSHMILCDVHWTPGDDQQCMGRIYRYGQQNPVFFYRLVAIDTVEETIFNRQKNKGAMALRLLTGERECMSAAMMRELEANSDDISDEEQAGMEEEVVQENYVDDNKSGELILDNINTKNGSENVAPVDPTLSYSMCPKKTGDVHNIPQFRDEVLNVAMRGNSNESGDVHAKMISVFTARAVHSVELYIPPQRGCAAATPTALQVQRDVSLLRQKHIPPPKPPYEETWVCTVCYNTTTTKNIEQEDESFIEDDEKPIANTKKPAEVSSVKRTPQIARRKHIAECGTCKSLFILNTDTAKEAKNYTRPVPVNIHSMGVCVRVGKTSDSVLRKYTYGCLYPDCDNIISLTHKITTEQDDEGRLPLIENIMCEYPQCRHLHYTDDKDVQPHSHTARHCNTCNSYTLSETRMDSRACIRCHSSFPVQRLSHEEM